jgi:Fe-S cluster assembly ATP-binding protein
MLSISNLHVAVGDKPILKGLTRDVSAGEANAIMGPNGAGAPAICYAGRRRTP